MLDEYTSFVIDDLGNISVVQDALVYLDRNKLSYGGQIQVNITEGAEVETHTIDEIINSAVSTLQAENSRITNPAGFYFAIPRDMLIGEEPYYENDFVVITSSDYVNENGNPETYKIQRMPGGAHSADKIDVNSKEFAREDAAEAIYNEDDSAITNVQTALNQLFKTKADLDRNNKIVLNQIPDTIIGTIDYQGIVKPEGNKITISKVLDIEDAEIYENDEFIQKGDYWVYQGEKLPLNDITLVDVNGNPIAFNEKVNVDGDKAYINNGDWFIASEDYSKDGDIVFDILDNTAPFIGITCGDNEDTVKGQDTLDGTVNFTGNYRGNTDLREATVTKNETGNGVLISSPNAALIADIANAASFKDYILKVNEYGVLVKGHIKDVENGIQLEGYDVLDEASGTTSTIKQKIVVNENASRTEETTITLPKNSGTLVTHEEVGLAKGRDNFNVMFNFDEETQQTKFIESPMEMHNPTDGNELDPTTAEGFVFHRDPNSATQVLFRKDEDGKERGNTVQIMPPLSGVLLNTNSIIDCGYWGEEGLAVYEKEPDKLEDSKLPHDYNTLEKYEDYLVGLAGGSDYETFKLTFNNNGQLSSKSVRKGGQIWLPYYESNKLYTFVGWQDGETIYHVDAEKTKLSPVINENTVLTAVWQTNTVAVVLKDIDGNILKTASSPDKDAIITSQYNVAFDPQTINMAVAEDSDYNLVGWTRDKEAAEKGYVVEGDSKVRPNLDEYLLNNYDESAYYDVSAITDKAKFGYDIYQFRDPFVTVSVEGQEGFIFNDFVTRGLVDTTFTDKIKEFIKDTIDYGTIGKGYSFYIYDAPEGGKENYIKIEDIFNYTFTVPTTIVARYEEDDGDDEYTSVYALEADGSTIYYELMPHYTDDWKNQLFDDLGLGKLYDKDKIDLITFELNTKDKPADYLNSQSTYDNPIRIGITIQEEIEAHLEDDPEPMRK